MKKIFNRIKDSYFKSLRGEENFLVVLFGWGVGVCSVLYCLNSILPVFVRCLSNIERSGISNISEVVTDSVLVISGLLMWIIIFAYLLYPLMFSFSLIKNIRRKDNKYLYLSALVAMVFLVIFVVVAMEVALKIIPMSILFGNWAYEALFILFFIFLFFSLFRFFKPSVIKK